ncbi:MAG TPA: RNase P subunit p30 family protein [Methanocella sp.]|nr:RNase P subunit p30 family protein [Methanocella sp.]
MKDNARFYDLGTHPYPEGSGSPARLLLAARRLGYAGIGATCHQEFFPGRPERLPAGVVPGVEIAAANANELRRGIDRFRGRVRVLAVHGGDEAINRAACEDGRVDVLAHPHDGKSPGLNHVIARLAADHGVAVEFSLYPLVRYRGGARVRALAAGRANFALVRKFGVPYVITSGALSSYDLRDVRAAVALCRLFGMGEADALRGLADHPAAIVRRGSPGYVMEGVEVLDRADAGRED